MFQVWPFSVQIRMRRERELTIYQGTENVYEKENAIAGLASTLKKHGDMILVPQPTDDPNDPLV